MGFSLGRGAWEAFVLINGPNWKFKRDSALIGLFRKTWDRNREEKLVLNDGFVGELIKRLNETVGFSF